MTQDDSSPDALILDVRSPMEFATGHVAGAINLPLDQFVDAYSQIIQNLTRPVVVYCASGARSGQAVQFLSAQGYTNVVNGISCHHVASRLGKSVV